MPREKLNLNTVVASRHAAMWLDLISGLHIVARSTPLSFKGVEWTISHQNTCYLTFLILRQPTLIDCVLSTKWIQLLLLEKCRLSDLCTDRCTLWSVLPTWSRKMWNRKWHMKKTATMMMKNIPEMRVWIRGRIMVSSNHCELSWNCQAFQF